MKITSLGRLRTLSLVTCILVLVLDSLAVPVQNTSVGGLTLPVPDDSLTFWQSVEEGVKKSRDFHSPVHPHVIFETTSWMRCTVTVGAATIPAGKTSLESLLIRTMSLRYMDCEQLIYGNNTNPAAPGGAIDLYKNELHASPDNMETGDWALKRSDVSYNLPSEQSGFQLRDLYHDHLTPGQLARQAVAFVSASLKQEMDDTASSVAVFYFQQGYQVDPQKPILGPTALITFLFTSRQLPPVKLLYDVARKTMTYRWPRSLASKSTIARPA